MGDNRTEFPHTCFAVAGTQAETTAQNQIIVMKLSNLRRTFKEPKEQDSDSDDSDSEDEEDLPELESAALNHNGCVNRIRVCIYY